jgi:hypothetical protein
MKALGILLLLGGMAALVWGGITYRKTERVLDVGDLEVTAQTQERIPLPPLAGGAAVLAGVALLVMSRRRAA